MSHGDPLLPEGTTRRPRGPPRAVLAACVALAAILWWNPDAPRRLSSGSPTEVQPPLYKAVPWALRLRAATGLEPRTHFEEDAKEGSPELQLPHDDPTPAASSSSSSSSSASLVLAVTAAVALSAVFSAAVSSWRRPRQTLITIAAFTGWSGDPAAHQARADPCLRRRTTQLAATGRDSLGMDAIAPAAFRPLLSPHSALGEHLWQVASDVPGVLPHSVAVAIRALSDDASTFAHSVKAVTPETAELYGRIKDLRGRDQAVAVQDLLYCRAMYQFWQVGVVTMGPAGAHSATSSLSEPIHQALATFSPEAQDEVEGRLTGILHLLQSQSDEGLMCTYHVAQAYAGAALFGYFLRQAEKRFALAKSVGPILSYEETVALLGELYNRGDPSHATGDSPPRPQYRHRPPWNPALTLREHLETLTPELMMRMMRMESLEAAEVLREHSTALFGDLSALQQQLMRALQDRPGLRRQGDLAGRLRSAMWSREVDTLRLTPNERRRLLQEAVAFGAFLRDSEAEVQALQRFPLLSPNNPLYGGGSDYGDWGAGDDSDDGGGGGGGWDSGAPTGPGGISATPA